MRATLLWFALPAALMTGVVCAEPAAVGAMTDPVAVEVYRPAAEIRKLTARGDCKEALSLADAELKRNSKNVNVRFLRGVVLSELNRTEEAKKVFEDMIRDYPEIAEPYNNLAVIYAAEGNIGRAKDLLETAAMNNPNSLVTFSNLGDTYLAQARTAYRKAAELAPKNKRIAERLAEVEAILK